MKKKKYEINWDFIILLIGIIAIVITIYFMVQGYRSDTEEAQDFCENQINGTYIESKCYIDNNGILYEVGLIKDKNDNFRVVIR